MMERFITSGLDDETRAAIGPIPQGHGFLGLIIRENRTIVVRDVMADPRRYGFPPHHPEMHSFLGTPVTVRGTPVGNLYLTEKEGSDEFTEADARLVESFALHAGIAIERARLHEEVRRLALVSERDRIAQDLHDGIIQSLYGVGLSLEDVPELIGEDRAEAERRVERAIDTLHVTIRDIRNFITGLRPEALETGDLADGLAAVAADARGGGVRDVRVQLDDGLDVGLEATVQVLQTAREAVSNAVRHSRATSITVHLGRAGDDIVLEVSDDGRGFDPDAALDAEHHGLDNLRARARSVGGSLAIESGPGRGTRVILRLPAYRGENGSDRSDD
jgi:signal transduction histidine kinase